MADHESDLRARLRHADAVLRTFNEALARLDADAPPLPDGPTAPLDAASRDDIAATLAEMRRELGALRREESRERLAAGDWAQRLRHSRAMDPDADARSRGAERRLNAHASAAEEFAAELARIEEMLERGASLLEPVDPPDEPASS